MADRFSKLTERERECLRLVRAQLSSKEIGLKLGLDAGTVDQHIKSAMRVLDVRKRGLAALALDAHERDGRELPPDEGDGHGAETLDIQSPGIAEIADSTILGPSMRGGAMAATGSDHRLREEHAPFQFLPVQRTSWPLRPAGGRRNDLTTGQIIGWSVAIMFAAILCLGLLLDTIGALQKVSTVIYDRVN